MTFSEFAQLLCPYFGKGQKTGNFVMELVSNILEDQYLEDIENQDKGFPLPDDLDSCRKIFNGSRQISSKNAGKILSHLDKAKFENYILNTVSDTTLHLFVLALQEKGIEVTETQIETVCTDLFASILEDCAKKKRAPNKNSSSKKQIVQGQIRYVDSQTTTIETDSSDENKQPLHTENFSSLWETLLSEREEDDQIIQIETTEDGENESQEPELSEPKNYGEYVHSNSMEQFGSYQVMRYDPLDPELIEKWGSVSITDEFCKRVKDYGIGDFVAIDPSELWSMRKIIKRDNLVAHIRSADRFAEYMTPAIDHMLISKENKDIFIDISNFVERLRQYLKLLKEHSTNSDLYDSEFILVASDDEKDLERDVNRYYDELKFRWENLKNRLKIED